DLDAIPAFRVPDVADGDVVVLAPEERHGVKRLAIAENVAGCRLPLALGHDPMLHANAALRIRIGPARDVAGGENAGRACLQVGIDKDAVVHGEARFGGELYVSRHTDASNDKVVNDTLAVLEGDAGLVDHRGAGA